jgi:hypothetical protein
MLQVESKATKNESEGGQKQEPTHDDKVPAADSGSKDASMERICGGEGNNGAHQDSAQQGAAGPPLLRNSEYITLT